MGKNARLREERKQIKEEREAQKLAQAKKEKRRNIIRGGIISAVALVAVAGVALAVFFGVIVNQGWYLRKATAMKAENFEVTGQMMAYYIYDTFVSYYSQYGENLGIDPQKSLKEQQFQEGVSWFDYFRLEALTNLRQVLLFAEKAKAEGMELTAEENAEIAEYAASADVSAYNEMFGFSVEDLVAAMELTTMAAKTYEKSVEELAIDDAKINAYFKENEKFFKMVDYKVMVIPYGTNGWYQTAATAKAAADRIAKATTDKAYDTAVNEVLTAIGASAADIETELSSAKQTGVYYKENDAVSTWTFGSAKVGNTYVAEMEGAYAVYHLTALPYIDDAATVNVQHILLTKEAYGTDAAAKAKAEELLDAWKKGEATAQSFGKLAEEHTEDTGSAAVGGLYENVSKGEMVEAFDKWIFDENRKEGDTDIVKTDYGYHIMYFVGEGAKAWEINARSAMIAENIDKLCATYTETWPVTVKNGVIKRLPL